MPAVRDYFTTRLPLLGAALFSGLICSQLCTTGVTQDADGLRLGLSALLPGQVGNIQWEPSRGPWLDFLLGRPLLFEARVKGDDPSGPRDIYRCVARLSPEGKVLSLGAAHNLTQTSQSDEHQLSLGPTFLSWVAQAPDAPASISLIATQPTALPHVQLSVLDRLQLGLTRWLETGSWSGVKRLDIIAPHKSAALTLVASGDQLEVTTRLPSASFTQRLPLRDWSAQPLLTTALGSPPLADLARWEPQQHKALLWSHFLANTLRELIGTRAVAQLEAWVFRARDTVLQARYHITHPLESRHALPPKTPLISPAGAADRKTSWPPADLEPSQGAAGDGKWVAWHSPLLPPSKEPLFYRTVLHTDPDRPYAELHLVAMDMRRLELGVRAGYEDPKPDTGPPGSGHVPKEVAHRVVATFNGAFKSTHGGYGMKAEQRLLTAPRVGAATVRIDATGRVGMGTWTSQDDEAQVLSLRQNLDALVERGAPNPKGRTSWGEHVDATGVAIERSALCMHHSGQLLYAWATEATGPTLAQGLVQAGCSYAMHLDMNPGHCTFALNRITSFDPLMAEGHVLDPRMKVNATRYVRWSPKDFFYLALRDPLHAPLADALGPRMRVDPGQQPEPSYIPGIFSADFSLGPLSMHITRVDPGRVSYQVAVGQAEGLTPSSALPSAPLTPHETALLAVGLGHHTHGMRPGLSVDLDVVSPLSRGYSTLVLRSGQPAVLLPPGEPLVEQKSLTLLQLPTLARDGIMLAEAKELAGKRSRHALCIDPAGTLYFGRLDHDSIAPLVQSLLELGCTLVVEADRGSHSPTYRARRGTGDPPQLGHAQTVLYAISQDMVPATYTF